MTLRERLVEFSEGLRRHAQKAGESAQIYSGLASQVDAILAKDSLDEKVDSLDEKVVRARARLQDAGDRRDWDGCNEAEEALEEILREARAGS